MKVAGVEQPRKSRIRIAPNSDNVQVKCDLNRFEVMGQSLESACAFITLEVTLPNATARRQIGRQSVLSKDSNGVPIWFLRNTVDVEVTP